MENEVFLGSGWSFPPEFSAGGRDIALVSGEADILQSLEILLSTQLRERTMQPDYGSALEAFLFEEMDQGLVSGVRNVISDAILEHEPRIEVEGVDVEVDDNDAGLALISVRYIVRATNNRFNMVYPFYLNEATNPIT
ncbi:MAG: GPW/gp25 family protein [Bacteroidota bacterium]